MSDATTRPREIWTRLTVDPLADPLARKLAPHPAVTPNRVTALAGTLGIGAAVCFATGELRWGGALFLLRFFADCLDGKVARLQGSASARGAFLDIATDVVTITLAAAALSWRLVTDGYLAPVAGFALLGALVAYNWSLDHRKRLAEQAGLGSGGARHEWRSTLPVIGAWVGWCRRIGMSAVPWVLEVEIAAFGLAPLLLHRPAVAVVIVAATGCYLLAVTVNFRRIWRITLVDPGAGGGSVPGLPVVDVVIATRDRPELLDRAIEAVCTQDYPGQVNVTVVFDQATPDPSLARSSGNRQVTVATNHRRPGLAGARNTGILAGTGTYVGFCDDDDAWLPGKLRAQVELLEAGAAPTAVTGILVEYGDRCVARIPDPADLTLERLVRHRVMEAHPSTVLVRRAALLDQIGLVDEEIPGSYGEDFDWIIRAARAGDIAVVRQALVRVLWGQSMFSRNWQTIVEAIDYGLRKTPEFSADPRALGRLYGRRAFALAALRHRDARRAVLRTIRVAPLEKRAYLAAAVTLHLISAERLMDLAHRHGHGI